MPAISEDAIRSALATHIDPVVGCNFIEADAVRQVSVRNGRPFVEIEVGFPCDGYKATLAEGLRTSLRNAFGVEPEVWSKVKGASGKKLLVDLVSLVRFALHQKSELVPYSETVYERFERWIAEQGTGGRSFTDEQVRWLEMMRDHIATSLDMQIEDFGYTPFSDHGGLARAVRVFGPELRAIVQELNEALAA